MGSKYSLEYICPEFSEWFLRLLDASQAIFFPCHQLFEAEGNHIPASTFFGSRTSWLEGHFKQVDFHQKVSSVTFMGPRLLRQMLGLLKSPQKSFKQTALSLVLFSNPNKVPFF